jgi:hypothetical protein
LYALAGWLAAALAAICVALVPYDPSGDWGGVWGRLPPLPALAAAHLLWLVVLGASAWVLRRWFPALLRPIGWVLLLGAVGGGSVLIWTDLSNWMAKVPGEFHQLWPKRIGYRLLTLSEVPLVQAALVGVVCSISGRRR